MLTYHCIQSDCANHDAQLPEEAARKLNFRCFLCKSELVPPPVPLEKIIDFVDTLPASIQIMPKLQALLSDANSSMPDIIGLIKTDASLVTGIVKASNSAYYAGSYYCSTIEDAMNRIGFSEAYNIIGYVAASQLLQQDLPLYGITSNELWSSSVRGATAMQFIGSGIRMLEPYVLPNSGVAYTVGLLRGVGRMLLNHYHEQNGIPALYNLEEPLDDEKEANLLGFTHKEAAEALLRKWRFQEEVTDPILHQDTPFACTEARQLACLVKLVSDGIRELSFDALIEDDQQTLRSCLRPDSGIAAALNVTPKTLLDGLTRSAKEFHSFTRSLSA